MVESVDDSFGKLIDKLRERNQLDNTIIVLTSDNGGLSTTRENSDIELATSVLPLRAGKGWLYEGGIRVPMIIGWKGKIKEGTHSSSLISGLDMYPTLLHLAGLKLEKDQHIDAIDQSGILLANRSNKQNSKTDNELSSLRHELFFHYPHYHASGMSPASTMIKNHFKLIYWYEDKRIELFNLTQDISETNDLSMELPEKTQEMKQRLDEWLITTDAQMIE